MVYVNVHVSNSSYIIIIIIIMFHPCKLWSLFKKVVVNSVVYIIIHFSIVYTKLPPTPDQENSLHGHVMLFSF